ncbi:MAG TPA: alpha/beta fold hydrolase [Kineosporiaceae bacterium]
MSAAVAGSLAGTVLVPAPSFASRASGGSDAAEIVPTIRWAPCGDAGPDGADCAMITVPLDYGRPNGTKIKLALSRVQHKPGAKYQGVMLVNPGGPGASGLGLSGLGKYVPNGAGDGYDWIGFDPRGVGASVPSLNCIKDYFAGPRPEFVPTTPALEGTWLGLSAKYAKACGKAGGDLLRHLRTTDVARDMDQIRAALRVPTLNFYGFSYGTYLGQVYATLFPNRVRRMVLDSNVDPTRVFYQANLDQDVAFQRNMQVWWAWVAKYDSVYHLGTTEPAVEKAWYAEKEKLRTAPAGGVVGPDEWTDIFLSAGYYQSTWTSLGTLWSDFIANGDPKPAIKAFDAADTPTDDNGFAVYNAVQCSDAPWPLKWATWKRDNWRVYAKAPFETWGNAWFNAPCLFWPVKAGKAVDVNGSHVAPILLVGETLDAATPFTGSMEVRKRFPASRLLALPGGTSHAASLLGDRCEDGVIAAYLADGTLPARRSGNRPDATCAPQPVPVPDGAPSSTSAAVGESSRLRPGTAAVASPLHQWAHRRLR